MGKAKKLKHLKAMRNQPLDQQIDDHNAIKPKDRQKFKNRDNLDENSGQQKYVDPKLTARILKSARKQQTELEEEIGLHESGTSGGDSRQRKETKVSLLSSKKNSDTESDNEYASGDETRLSGDDCYEAIEITPEDERALEMFMNRDEFKRKTLADIIAEKIKEKETEIQTQLSDATGINIHDLDDKVVDLYKGVKQVLSRYRSGKLPKAFKIIPGLANWEQILQITEPESWTASSMLAATRIFTSNLKERMAQRFFNLILLPRLRDDIAEYKRLNFHLYQSMRKALFKTGAFFKGIIIPLCESGNCTLREAVIIGSVMAKHHIPLLHSCAAMLKIAEMEYSGANTVFLHILINKKYALPFRVIDALVYHFLRFANEKRQLPVLWHQCLLVFVQHYKQDISSEQKEALMELLRVQTHYQITPEIRKVLLNSKARDEEMAEPSVAETASVTESMTFDE
ncbi:bystin-like [Oppia nitens]|uniref:bystin-like n=1 Tax=Oppia nitens TaxID=1686743 RepID=UPI0023DBA6B9|nr:bystin-like [Oppia nitens]